MTESHIWLDRYEHNHQDLTWPWIYWPSVLMVLLGTVGALWALPVPAEFYAISPLLNWGSAFLMAAAIYYFIISLSLAIGLLPFLLGLAFFQMWLQQSGYVPMRVAGGLLLAGIIGLSLGHRNRNRLRALVEDLQTIMIGPAWLLASLYRILGIPY